MRRWLRKHRAAVLAIAIYNLALFFPVLFMGRIVSPNDIFYNYSPWAMVRPHEMSGVANSLLNDSATAWYPVLPLVRSDWRVFHWDPYLASGVPGFGAFGALGIFGLIPTLLLPLKWFYTGMIFLKLNAAFVFAYLWLREERLGKRGAAVGAIVVAGASIYAVRWLWQITNVTALYPLLLWLLARIFNGRRNSIALMTIAALVYALAAFPSAMFYGVWIVVAYLIYALVRRRAIPVRPLAAGAVAAILALCIAAPSLASFTNFIRRSGYLGVRESISEERSFPLAHAQNFLDPERLGNPVTRWTGDPALSGANNYVEATLYIGLLTIPFALAGCLNRRAMRKGFWIVTAVVLLGGMFGAPGVSDVLASIPGVKFTALWRLSLLLPLAAGYLAAAGASVVSRRFASAVIAAAALLSFDLAVVAGRFHPYLEPPAATIVETPMTEFLAEQEPPFRVAPFFDYLWPNTAEMIRVEDVRSHFASERDYRALLQRIDRTSWTGKSTLLTFNSLEFDFQDPMAGLLGIRWYIEHKDMDIIRWKVFERSHPIAAEGEPWPIDEKTVIDRTIRIEPQPFWAVEIPAWIDQGSLHVSLFCGEERLWARAFSKSHVDVMNKIYVPVRPLVGPGETIRIRVESRGATGRVGRIDAPPGEDLFYARVATPVIFDRELPDGRLYRNLAEVPRFRAVTDLRKLNDEEFLALHEIDFARAAVITDDPVLPAPLSPARTSVDLASYEPHRQRLTTVSDAPFFLASTEKKTPELAVTIDGQPAKIVETDMLFAGIFVPAGRHEIVFSRRLGRGWWPVSIAAASVWLGIAILESARRLRRH
jgi:hypothetical protein